MHQRLRGKIVLVTGAAQGIGRAISLRFAQEGADIVINDLRKKELEILQKEIQNLGRKSLIAIADVSQRQEVENMRHLVKQELGRLDILVNNAAIARIIPFWEMTEEIWDRILDINLKGTFLCCWAFVPMMIERRSGKIINISSKSGKVGSSAFAAYCASKFGVIGLTQSLALDLAPYGITVNAICPGIVFTPHWEELKIEYARKKGIRPVEVKAYLESKIPLGRAQTPEEVAAVAAFLASSEADGMTGQAINVTGGQEMR